MEYSLTFARHYAHLVWLLINEDTAFDVQIATLRLLVNASKDGAVTFTTRDRHLLVNGGPVPMPLPGAQDLATQLIGHSITELRVEGGASPAELLGSARMLASEPLPGDGGRTIQAALRALEARAVRVTMAPSRPAQSQVPAGGDDGHAIPGLVRDGSIPMPFLDEERATEQLLQSLADIPTPKGSMVKLFEQLGAARTSAAIGRELAGLVKLALESARKGRLDMVADILFGIVEREQLAPDGPFRRHLAIAIRRLTTPTVLSCVAEILPQRAESYEQYMAVLARAEDAGIEALVDALIAAPSIGYRRLYFDSLVRLGTGARMLLHMLGDPRWYVARNAAELLGEMGVAEAEPELTKLLGHPDDRVRAAAGGALAKLGASTGAWGVRAALRGVAADVRESAAEAVRGHGGARSVNSLARALDREEDDGVQRAMLTALARIGTPAAVEKLVAIANSEQGIFKRTPTPLRVAAVHALGDVESPAAMDALQRLLRDDQKEVRGAASWVMLGRKRKEEG